MTDVQWPVSIERNYYQFSYRILQSGGATRLALKSLQEAVRIAGEAVRNVVWTGWSMFHQFSRKEIAPTIVVDRATGEEIEALETDLRGETLLDTTLPEVWRITADGRAVIIRPYREDRPPPPERTERGLLPGSWLSPHTLIREVYEFVTHAKEIAKAFPNAERIEFRCGWFGLKGRRIGEFAPGAYWHDRTCHTSERSTTASVSIDELVADTASIVVELAAPVLRLFGGIELTREWVVSEVPKFRTL